MTTKKKPGKKQQSKTSIARGRAIPKSRFPAHLRVDTPEEWRGLKRKEWREVTQALERYHWGSAYCPAGDALYHLQRLAMQITAAMEAEDWIAW